MDERATKRPYCHRWLSTRCGRGAVCVPRLSRFEIPERGAGFVKVERTNVQIFAAHGASHREVPIRVDLNNPFKDPRVRQALALTLDRPAIVKTLFDKYADVGNDSNFAPLYPSTDTSVPQRHKDLAAAKKLMAKVPA